jgi:hypothetical protein
VSKINSKSSLKMNKNRSVPACYGEQLHPRDYVFVLRAGGHGTSDLQVLVVEKVPNHYATGAFDQ